MWIDKLFTRAFYINEEETFNASFVPCDILNSLVPRPSLFVFRPAERSGDCGPDAARGVDRRGGAGVACTNVDCADGQFR